MIEFDNVSKTYANGTEALKNVSLRIEDGEFVFIVGSSGAGKSTFLKIMMREQVPNKGTVIINGFNLNKLKKKQIPMFRRTLGIVFQDFQLLTDRNVLANLEFVLDATGMKSAAERRERIEQVLNRVGMDQKSYKMPHELSGGEQQRIVIARALLNNPEVILADEPTGNLDPETGEQIFSLLSEISLRGTTVVLATHNHAMIDRYPGRVFISEDRHLSELP